MVKKKGLKEHRISVEGASYHAQNWLVLRDGGSDQWLYACRLRRRAFIFIEITDLPAYCGRDATARWDASVKLVDLVNTSGSTIKSALDSCGFYENKPDGEVEPLHVAEMLLDVGSSAPLWSKGGGKVTFDGWGNCNESYDENCPSFRSLRKKAREYAETLLRSEEVLEAQLNTPVNALGMTAREYADGSVGLFKALHDIKAQLGETTTKQQLVLKLYQQADVTLDGTPIPKTLKT